MTWAMARSRVRSTPNTAPANRRYDAPFRSRTAPLAHCAPGEARYTTASATSSAVATRLNGLCARIASPARVASSSAVMSVATYPGATDATVIPVGASATASDCPNACNPALLAPYAG
jgi:hypothetical protein